MATKVELEEMLADAQAEIESLKKQLAEKPPAEFEVTPSDIRAAKIEHQNCLRKGLLVNRKDGFYCKYHHKDIYA